MTKSEEITVIGIDPAPSKRSTIFNGENFQHLSSDELKKYIKELYENTQKVLICWDAPLSFSTKQNDSPFTQRIIEKLFMRNKLSKTPKGISVLGYSGCPHWTISQYILGYPKISSFENEFNPPFELVFDRENIEKSVTEVHPAVAIWLWCKGKKNEKNEEIKNWEYKKSKAILREVIEVLVKEKIITDILKIPIENDDELDAYIAWKLGTEWLKGNNTELEHEVKIMGNNDTGSFLLPNKEELFKDFKEFEEKEFEKFKKK